MSGEFLESFFSDRGDYHVKPNNEADVKCPFLHSKGYEQHASAHVNTEKGVFHCKTCRAEGRFNEGGLSEIGFVAQYYRIPYGEASRIVSQFTEGESEGAWKQAHQNLLDDAVHLEWLANRGIDLETVKKAKLGSYLGGTIVYPVFMNGIILDKRAYNPKWREENTPKIKSMKGASNALFPFDMWDKDKPTLLSAGENDTLLAHKWGFNALTTTFGEGNFPRMFLPMFSGKTVYICYDCDDAGRQGALKVAFDLFEVGANVFIVDLGLFEGQGKDITDIWKLWGDDHGRVYMQEMVLKATAYTGEMYEETKDIKYPLVDLWEVHHAKWHNRYISSRVVMMGKYDKPLETPVAMEWKCKKYSSDSNICAGCPNQNDQGWWTLEQKDYRQLLELVETDDNKQKAALRKFVHIPAKCPGSSITVREVQSVTKAIFVPDAETEDELSGFRMVEHYSYVLGQDLEDGQRYRVYMQRCTHPDSQVIVSVVDRVEESDNAVNRFKMTPQMLEQLGTLHGDPNEVMAKRFELAKQVAFPGVHPMVVEAINIMYHSVLDFKYGGQMMKGHPEGLVVGESRTGKTSVFKSLQQFYRMGNITECKTATTAGLLGGADKAPSGGHRIKWGVVPRNNRGLLCLDELSGMPTGVMASLTGLRSERIARIVKIESGAAPAKVRLLWISNPRVQSDGKSRPIALYPNGVSIVLDLIGSDEDVARFDFICVLPPTERYVSPFDNDGASNTESTGEPYRNLIHWVWSRRPEQIRMDTGVEEYIWQVAQELNERFDTDVKLFGAEAHKKLTRIAVAVAGMCFSHDGTGDNILVQKTHVDWARDFLTRCYDNPIFRLVSYVDEQRQYSTTNEEINGVFANLAKSQPLLIKALISQSEASLMQLQIVSGLDRAPFADAVSNMVRHGLIKSTGTSVMPTLRFKKALDAYRLKGEKVTITPLSQKGVLQL